MIAQNKRLFTILGIATGILLLPLIGMQFPNTGVDWSLSDFIIGGILLFGTGLCIELVLRKIKSKWSRILICLAVFAVLVLVWAELAVGIFGTPFAGS